jgi:hypothetical protein
LRDNLLLHELVLPLVGTIFDDLLGGGVANARECFEFLGGFAEPGEGFGVALRLPSPLHNRWII